jgi:hypothetical protein
MLFGLAACVGLALAGLSPGARADEPAPKATGDPAREFADLQKSWSEAQAAFLKAYQEAKTTEERQQILKEKRPKPAEFAERFRKFAEAHPDSPEAGQALGWIVSNARGTDAAKQALAKLKEKVEAATDLDQLHKAVAGLPTFGVAELAPVVAERARKNLDHPQAVPLLVWVAQATLYSAGSKELSKLYNDTVDLLVERFVERPELAPLPGWLAQDDDPPWAEKKLRRLLEKSPSADVKANARFSLGSILKNKDEDSQAEAGRLLQGFIDDFANAPEKQTQVQQARSELADMKGERGIGKPVPDIAGADLDGKSFKLSDYKGKVVLLDFWGFW